MTDKKKLEIIFAPGCFDSFDGTQEELNQLMEDIQRMADSGELETQAVPLSELLDELSEEEIQDLLDEVSEEIGVEELSSGFIPQLGNRTLH